MRPLCRLLSLLLLLASTTARADSGPELHLSTDEVVPGQTITATAVLTGPGAVALRLPSGWAATFVGRSSDQAIWHLTAGGPPSLEPVPIVLLVDGQAAAAATARVCCAGVIVQRSFLPMLQKGE